MWYNHKVRKIPIIIVTALFVFGLINIIHIPPAHAVGGITPEKTLLFGATGGTSLSFTPTGGDIMVIALQIVLCQTGTFGCGGLIGTLSTPTDSQGDTYTRQAHLALPSGCGGSGTTWNCFTDIWSAPIASSVSTTVTITLTNGGTSGQGGGISIYDVGGSSGTAVCTATGSSGTGTAVTTSTTCAVDSTHGAIASIYGDGAGSGNIAGSGFTDFSSATGNTISEYSTTASSPTNFPYTLGVSGAWQETGATFSLAPPNVTQPLSICTQEPGSSPLSIMIPLYETPGADWATIENSALANPALKYTIIFNPSSGPGAAFSSTYNTAINTMINDGVRVLGYIPTKYTHQPVVTVENNITKYTTFYPQINGIFFDQVGMTAGNFSYYSTLVSFVNTQNYKFSYTVGNPGVGVSNLLYNVFSDLNIWEKTGTPSNLILSVVTANPASQFSFIANGISTGADTNSTYLTTITPYVGNVYITSNNLYTSLPSYFATLVSNLVSTATGAPRATFALSGTANPSPSTLLSNNKGACTFTNITVAASSTLTITVPAAGTFTRFVFNSSATSSTTFNITTCSSGTCPSKQVDTYYQIANAYAAQAIKPTLFNGAYNLPINGTNAGASSSIILPILVNTNQATSGLLYFDYGTVSMPTSFMIKSLLWSATPASSATISNTNSGDFTLIVGYSGSNFTLVSTVTITKQVEKTVIVTNQQTQCIDTNSCGSNQLGSFLILLLPALIIIGIFEYIPYVLGAKDGRIYVLTFMFAISIVGFLSSLGAFGVNAIPWYIPIFIDIMGFMIILTYKPDSSGF